MTRKTLISLESVSKAFVLYKKPLDILYDALKKSSKNEYYWALKDISFSLQEGDRLAIIGENGAGKSTLLSIIAGTLPPTSGKLTVNGKITSMLSLTSFLNEQQTGVENILFNLKLLNLPKVKINQLMEEIIDFTELESFIFSPVRTYSSGMKARLAFTITTAMVPDILIVDEVLAVGDSYFVGKTTQRMKELCEKGRGLLYVSHSIAAVQMLCDRAVWLDQGTIRRIGSVKEVTEEYEAFSKKREDIQIRPENAKKHQKALDTVQARELENFDWLRFRIVPENGTKFCDMHYINAIKIKINNDTFTVPIELEETPDSEKNVTIDLFNSQWGQYYEKEEKGCRALKSSGSSLLRGAQFSVKKPELSGHSTYDLSMELVYYSEFQVQNISVEYLDESSLKWTKLDQKSEQREKTSNKNFWKTLTLGKNIPAVSAPEREKNIQAVEAIQLSDVVVKSAHVEVDGEVKTFVQEREPFKIIVEAQVTKPLENFEIIIVIRGVDGTYMFYQSSGFNEDGCFMKPGRVVEEKLRQPGTVFCEFVFDPNFFASGEYTINGYAANGWNFPENFPQSEIYDRNLNLQSFTVQRQHPIIGFGLINQRVKTRIWAADAPSKKIRKKSQ